MEGDASRRAAGEPAASSLSIDAENGSALPPGGASCARRSESDRGDEAWVEHDDALRVLASTGC